MAIREPNIVLSELDREALGLLAQLVLAADESETGHNASSAAIPLSLSQARRLIELLEQLFSSRRFVEGSYFAEGIANGHGWTDSRLKEIYLSSRRRLGFTRVAATFTWNDFVVRSGYGTSKDARLWPRLGGVRSAPMEFEYFLKMEQRLAIATNLHPRVRSLILSFLVSQRANFLRLQEGAIEVPQGRIRSFAESFMAQLGQVVSRNEVAPISRRKLVAVSTLVMDVGALFITRDWTATATSSMIGSTFPDIVA